MVGRWFGRGRKDQKSPVDEPMGSLSFEVLSPPEAPSELERFTLDWSPSGFVTTDEGGDIYVTLSGVKETRMVLKELRLQKRALSAKKRAITQEMAAIRREYSAKNARRGPSIRGGGQVGMVLRAFDQVGRASDRESREEELEPLEQEKREYEAAIDVIDRLVHHCDAHILRQKAIEGFKQPSLAAMPISSPGTFCTSCGAELEPDHRFCDQRGVRVDGE